VSESESGSVASAGGDMAGALTSIIVELIDARSVNHATVSYVWCIEDVL